MRNGVRSSAIRGVAAALAGLLLAAPAPPARAQPAAIQVEAEHYVRAYDTTPGNSGGACRSDDVDVRAQAGGCTVGWWAAGEWLAFDVVVPAAGVYALELRAATGVPGNRLTLQAADDTLSIAVPVTGSAGRFATVPGGSIRLAAGAQQLRLTGHGHSMDLDSFTLRWTGPAPGHPHLGPPPAPPGRPLPDRPTNQGPFFQIACPATHRRSDDPIVFPGQPGASHLHQFFGNPSVHAGSTYAAMLAAETSCRDGADRAGYWVPALYADGATLTTPYRLRAYYFANAADRDALQAFPPNLRMLAGDPRASAPQPRGVVDWLCRGRRDQAAGRPLRQADPPACRADEFLAVAIRFPDCWDGVNLDSADHRSHMAYADAGGRCPASHPVKVPKLRYSITYEGTAWHGGDFTLGGPRGAPLALPAAAMHADFWNTWQQDALEAYVAGCLRAGRTVRSAACR